MEREEINSKMEENLVLLLRFCHHRHCAEGVVKARVSRLVASNPPVSPFPFQRP